MWNRITHKKNLAKSVECVDDEKSMTTEIHTYTLSAKCMVDRDREREKANGGPAERTSTRYNNWHCQRLCSVLSLNHPDILEIKRKLTFLILKINKLGLPCLPSEFSKQYNQVKKKTSKYIWGYDSHFLLLFFFFSKEQ